MTLAPTRRAGHTIVDTDITAAPTAGVSTRTVRKGKCAVDISPTTSG